MPHCLVCGMSRSGTTLLVTMLDSHPEISMGYENACQRALRISQLQRRAIEQALLHASNAKEVELWLKENDAQPIGRFRGDKPIEPLFHRTICLRSSAKVDQSLDRTEAHSPYAMPSPKPP